jgi:hypothetical protein
MNEKFTSKVCGLTPLEWALNKPILCRWLILAMTFASPRVSAAVGVPAADAPGYRRTTCRSTNVTGLRRGRIKTRLRRQPQVVSYRFGL